MSCDPAQDASTWLFTAKEDSHADYSCASEKGGVNDLGNAPKMCEGDATSVRLAVQKGKAECLKAVAGECGIPMRNFVSLDYDFSMSKCEGIWAAPLDDTTQVAMGSWLWRNRFVGVLSSYGCCNELCGRWASSEDSKVEYGQIRGTHHREKGREWNRHILIAIERTIAPHNARSPSTAAARIVSHPRKISLVGATNLKIFMDQEDVRMVGIVYGHSCLIFGTE